MRRSRRRGPGPRARASPPSPIEIGCARQQGPGGDCRRSRIVVTAIEKEIAAATIVNTEGLLAIEAGLERQAAVVDRARADQRLHVDDTADAARTITGRDRGTAGGQRGRGPGDAAGDQRERHGAGCHAWPCGRGQQVERSDGDLGTRDGREVQGPMTGADVHSMDFTRVPSWPGWADDPELLATFRAEVEERVASLQAGLLALEAHPSPRQVLIEPVPRRPHGQGFGADAGAVRGACGRAQQRGPARRASGTAGCRSAGTCRPAARGVRRHRRGAARRRRPGSGRVT